MHSQTSFEAFKTVLHVPCGLDTDPRAAQRPDGQLIVRPAPPIQAATGAGCFSGTVTSPFGEPRQAAESGDSVWFQLLLKGRSSEGHKSFKAGAN